MEPKIKTEEVFLVGEITYKGSKAYIRVHNQGKASKEEALELAREGVKWESEDMLVIPAYRVCEDWSSPGPFSGVQGKGNLPNPLDRQADGDVGVDEVDVAVEKASK